MADNAVRGSCLCGDVAYAITGPVNRFLQCHCSRCRKMTGTAYASNLFVDADSFAWVRGESRLSRYDLPAARAFATSFCRACGSHMPYRIRGSRTYVVPAGALDDDPGLTPQRTVYWASRAPWFVHTDTVATNEEGL